MIDTDAAHFYPERSVVAFCVACWLSGLLVGACGVGIAWLVIG